MKRTFGIRLIWIAPIFSIIITFLLGGGQNGVYNWWYTMFLPGVLTLISSLIVQKMKKRSIVEFYHCQLKKRCLDWKNTLLHYMLFYNLNYFYDRYISCWDVI